MILVFVKLVLQIPTILNLVQLSVIHVDQVSNHSLELLLVVFVNLVSILMMLVFVNNVLQICIQLNLALLNALHVVLVSKQLQLVVYSVQLVHFQIVPVSVNHVHKIPMLI